MKFHTLPLLLIILIFSGCTTKPLQSGDSQNEVIPVQAELVKRSTFSQTLEVPGRLRSKQDMPIVIPSPKMVTEVYVELGENVLEGDPLITFDDEQARTQLEQAQRHVNQLEDALQELQQLKRQAKQAQKTYQTEYQETMDRAQAVLNGAQTGAVTMLDLLQASTQMLWMQNQMQNVPLENAFNSVNPTELQMQLEQAKSQLRIARNAVEALTVRAPFDGTITLQRIGTKETAMPNTPLLQLSNLSEIIVDLQVGSNQIDQLQQGMPSKVTVEGMAQPIEATLDTLSPGASLQGNLYQAQITLPNEQQTLFPGKLATASITIKHWENTLLIPVQAVFFEENQAYTYIVDAHKKAQKRAISLAERNRTHYRVVHGLEGNEQVITTGRETVTDGSLVYIQK